MKRVVLSSLKMLSIFTISIFILIPSINAKETTKTYVNYYYFLEDNELGENNELNDNLKNESIFETAFAPPKYFAAENEKKEIVKLYRSSSSNKKTYQAFYDEWNKVEKNGTEIKYQVDNGEDGCVIYGENNCGTRVCTSKVLTSTKDNEITSKFLHGCYRRSNSKIWRGGISVEDYEDYNDSNNNNTNTFSSLYACASIDRIGSSKVDDILDLETGKSTDGKTLLYATVKRKGVSNRDINIEEPLPLQENINSCKGKETDVNPLLNKKIYSPVLVKQTYVIPEYSCDGSKNVAPPKCNSSNSIESDCQKLTIDTGTGLADVTIEQKGTITNILTPKEIYQGGGIKFGFIYYNTIKWNYAEGGRKLGNLTKVPSTMKQKLKESFENQIMVDIKFDEKSLDNSLIQKKCTKIGSFNEGETVTTICTIFLPNSNVEMGTGKVDYNNSKYTNYGINNQYYTPLTFTGNYQVSATLSRLNVLNPNDADGIEEWTMKFDDEESCKVNVTSRLYEENPTNDKSASYKFIYRPINLNDPFPDRNAGVNWYKWYSKDSNKKRLQESYSKLQYQVTLDNQIVAKIKDYNTNHNYLEWDNIENGESKFIDTYFTTKRENLGDGS